MNYGYFDDEKREYVITRPDTPAPWANYLGSPEYGALITGNAGGYSFRRSGANGRILRYVFNHLDHPGRYVYLRDDSDGDYWSVSWAPVCKPLDQFKSECRHGTSYTKIASTYREIHAQVEYYVPLGEEYEVWHTRVTNTSEKTRSLTLTGYCEFTDENNYEQDQVNLQYSLFITRTVFAKDRIRQLVKGNFEKIAPADVDERFFGMAGLPVSSWCGDRQAFLGRYHDYKDPQGVVSGNLGNVLNYCKLSCGALSAKLKLEPGETKELVFLLGMQKEEASAKIMKRYQDPSVCEKELEDIRTYWHSRISHLQVQTPSKAFDHMINTWHAYNCFMTFTWSRAASLIYCGLRNGYGYRDTVQDIQGVIHLDPAAAKEKISFMLSAQVHHGGGLPLVKFDHHAGHEDTPEQDSYVRATGHPAYRADDALWLFPTIWKYLAETGDLAYLKEEILFADKDCATVYEHLKRALEFSENHLGPHGMPAGLHADWNDCLRLGANGESVFVAMQYYYALEIMKELAELEKDVSYMEHLHAESIRMKALLDSCLDEDRYIRGYTQDGMTIGAKDAKEANLWLNPQSWSVISKVADQQTANQVMALVKERLNTPYGAILMDPPFGEYSFDGALATVYNAGTKENAGIFLQTQGWLILAEALLGHGDQAFAYYLESCPAAQNDIADIRELEPYCYGQFTEGKDSPMAGRSHVHWLTGTASTIMVGCVEGILGLRPDPEALNIDPAIPSSWDGFSMEKDFRGCHLSIHVHNPEHKESGVRFVTVNGTKLAGNKIRAELLTEHTVIEVWM